MADRKAAAHVNTQWPEPLSDRHRKLLSLLRSRAHRDAAGRLVSWWPQAKLAAELGVSVRTLQNMLADLREPTSDPRHPTAKPPGRRLGLIRVEPTTYRDASTRRHRLGGNLYVLVEPCQHATSRDPVSAAHVNTQANAVACLNKGEPTATPVEGQGSVSTGEGEHATASEVWPAYADCRYYSGPGRRAAAPPLRGDPWRVELQVSKDDQFDHQLKASEILGVIRAGLGGAEVLDVRRHPTYRNSYGRTVDLETCTPAALHGALIDLQYGNGQKRKPNPEAPAG
jgi:hypothetical protein